MFVTARPCEPDPASTKKNARQAASSILSHAASSSLQLLAASARTQHSARRFQVCLCQWAWPTAFRGSDGRNAASAALVLHCRGRVIGSLRPRSVPAPLPDQASTFITSVSLTPLAQHSPRLWCFTEPMVQKRLVCLT